MMTPGMDPVPPLAPNVWAPVPFTKIVALDGALADDTVVVTLPDTARVPVLI